MVRMPPRSFADDTKDGAWRWLLFARQLRADAFVLTIIAHSKRHGDTDDGDASKPVRAMYELQLDASGLRAHTEELGIEVELEPFAELFTTTLATRSNVDVALDPPLHGAPPTARLVLSYKFSESISRRGTFALPVVASAVPSQVVELLAALHATPHTPVLTAAQQSARDATARPTISAAELAARTFAGSMVVGRTSQRTVGGSTTSSYATGDADATNASATPLKRRPMPPGAVRTSNSSANMRVTSTVLELDG